MKRYLFVCSLIVIALSSCGNGNEAIADTDPDSQPVIFGVTGVDTRTVETNTTTISEFSVFCFNTILDKWEDIKTTALPEKMFNQRVERNGNYWEYNPPVYWGGIASGYHTFFGYSPSAQGQYDPIYNRSGNNISVKMGKNADGTEIPLAGAPILDFEVMSNIGDQVDLLRSTPHYNLSPLTPLVNMHFQHALTCVGFRAYSGIAGTSVDYIRIANIYKKGTLNIETGDWTIDPMEKGTYVYDQQTFVTTDGQNPTPISHPNGYFMLLPQDFKTSNPDQIKVEFIYTQNGQQLTKEYVLKENWAVGKRTIYTVDLGGTPNEDLNVTEIEITDWQFTYGGELQTGNQFNLILDPNEGELGTIPATQRRLTASYDPLTSTLPTRADWVFIHWNEKKDGTGVGYVAGDRFRMPKTDVTLYAQWGQEYTLTYNENEGDATLMPAQEKRISKTSVSLAMPAIYDETVGNAAYKHLKFREWNTQANGQGESYTTSKGYTMPANDVTLYAQWDKLKYMLICMRNDDPDIDPDNGTAWKVFEDIEYGTSYILPAAAPIREGYTFTGWNTEPNGSGTPYSQGESVMVREDTGLYAQWGPKNESINSI